MASIIVIVHAPRPDLAGIIDVELGGLQHPDEANEHDGRAEPEGAAGLEGAGQPDGPDDDLNIWGMPSPRMPSPPSVDPIEDVWGNLPAGNFRPLASYGPEILYPLHEPKYNRHIFCSSQQ